MATEPRTPPSDVDPWRSLALRVVADLSWCVGFIEQIGQPIPSSVRATLDTAIKQAGGR